MTAETSRKIAERILEHCEKHKTNADRIRSMTDEELAAFMAEETESYLSGAGNKWLDWLRQEAET